MMVRGKIARGLVELGPKANRLENDVGRWSPTG